MALADAAAECPADIRARLLERLLEAYRPAWPQVPFLGGLMEEARFWADMASRAELKAYALACWEAMPEADRKAFIVYISGEVAA